VLKKCKESAERGAFLALHKQKKVEILKIGGIITKAITRDEEKEKVMFGETDEAAGCYFC